MVQFLVEVLKLSHLGRTCRKNTKLIYDSGSFNHSCKKRKDSLEPQVLLLIFYLELEISGEVI